MLNVLHGFVKPLIRKDGREYVGWSNHPALLMWKGHRGALRIYTQCMIDEWIARGYNNTIDLSRFDDGKELHYPEWHLDDSKIDRLCASHRSALLYKAPAHYRQFGWKETPSDPKRIYYWPTSSKI